MSEREDTCLQCGQSRAEVKANNTFCATVTGYEVVETLDEWERHHWRDWSDEELKRHGIDPSKWNAHRRTGIYDLEWPARESHCLRAGHTEPDPEWFGVDVCPVCYVNLKEQRDAGEPVRMKEKTMTDSSLRTAIARALSEQTTCDGEAYPSEVHYRQADAVLAVLRDLPEPVIERAARELFLEDANVAYEEWPEWDSPENIGKPIYIENARAAFRAAFGGEQG